MTNITAPLRVLSLGWGVQSFTLAAMMALDELPRADVVVHADTGHEREATYAFADRWASWLGERGVAVHTVRSNRTGVVMQEWPDSVLIPAYTSNAQGGDGQMRRQCTHDWKVAPVRRFIVGEMKRRNLRRDPGAVEMITGISFDEWQRMRTSDVAYIANAYPLVDRRITRAACVAWLESHGLPTPPKSSCTFCPYHSIASWKALKRESGKDWQEAVLVDATIRDRRPGFALFVHPYRQPLPDAVSIPEDIGARQLGLELEQPCDSGACWT